jgi:hypothetical protein
MAAQRDWSTPENRIKKQNAFRLYAAGRKMADVMAALGATSPPVVKRFIHSEKWDKHKDLWNAAPNEELLYPWEVENVTTLSLPPEKMETMGKDKRLQCIKAFAMYCSGRSVSDVALEVGVSHSTVDLWKDAQRWDACRARLVNESAPAPWEDSGVPTLISDITASLEAMKKSIKFLTGKVLIKAADAAQDLDGMEALGMMRNIKQLAEAASINFSDGSNQQNAIQINIASKLESIKIPNNTTFEAELVVHE